MFEASEAPQKPEGTKKIKTILFHWYSWNSVVETTLKSLIGWLHRTSNEYVFPFSSSETLISLSGETGQQDRIQMVEWSPVDHSLAVVVANDLYFMKDALTGGKAKRLTESGKDGLVINRIADWLYEAKISKTFT